MSPELHVTAQTPPTFLFTTTDDHTVPVLNSVMFYSALVKAGVPAEMHIFQHGAHGSGLARGESAVERVAGAADQVDAGAGVCGGGRSPSGAQIALGARVLQFANGFLVYSGEGGYMRPPANFVPHVTRYARMVGEKMKWIARLTACSPGRDADEQRFAAG